MARITPLVIPTGIIPPSKRCEECADARQEATEGATRKRTRNRKGKKEAESETPDAPGESPDPES